MRRKNVNNEVIRECITEALLLLMQKEPFQKITISELTQKAGVGRVSFYRNYASKEDVLVKKLKEEAELWWKNFHATGSTDYVRGLFEHCIEMQKIVKQLYRHDLSYLLLKNVNDCMGPLSDDAPDAAYKKACWAGCVFGVLNEWIRRGMEDGSDEMSRIFSADFFIEAMKNYD